MERPVFPTIATAADRQEYRKWVRRISAFYGVVLLAGISFAVVQHHQSASRDAIAAPAVAGTSLVAINQVKR